MTLRKERTQLASDEAEAPVVDSVSSDVGDTEAAGATAAEREVGEPDTVENAASGDGPEIRIEVVLGDLNTEQIRMFRSHVEPWEHTEFSGPHP